MFTNFTRTHGTDEILGGLLLVAAITWSAATVLLTPGTSNDMVARSSEPMQIAQLDRVTIVGHHLDAVALANY
jgi:hypothetical protein